MPTISVIIPTYNRATYVTKAIDSILAQTYTDYEIIVVDDGSTDNTKEVLKPYKDKINYIYQENRGVSSARNTGIHAALGQWIAFLDSDDIWLPDKLSSQIRCVRNTDAEVCFTKVTHIHKSKSIGEKNKCDTVQSKEFAEPFTLVLDDSKKLYIQAMLVERDLLERMGGFDESMKVAEDTKLIYDLAFQTSFIYIYTPMVKVNRTLERDGLINKSLDTRRRLWDAHVSIVSDAYSRYKENNEWNIRQMRRLIGYAFSRRAEVACVDKEYNNARRFAKKALKNAGDLKTFLRSIAVYLFPSLVAERCKRIWK
jgi:glycosyltransferase involved in cell wall biosynthesis